MAFKLEPEYCTIVTANEMFPFIGKYTATIQDGFLIPDKRLKKILEERAGHIGRRKLFYRTISEEGISVIQLSELSSQRGSKDWHETSLEKESGRIEVRQTEFPNGRLIGFQLYNLVSQKGHIIAKFAGFINIL